MFVRLILFILLLPAVQAADSLTLRLAAASDNAEYISNQLLALAPHTLSSEDWLVLAEAQLRLRNKDAAMDAASHALNSATEPYLQAHGYLLKAQIYGILYRDTIMAISQLELAEQLLQQAEDSASLALYSDVLQNFAQAYNQLGNIPQAIPYAQRSLALALRQQQPAAELKARITLGRLTLQNNAYSQAYQHLNQALSLATQLQDQDALASIHLRLGMAYRKIDYHPQALQHLLQAKQLYQQLQRQSSYTYTLIYIAETYLEDAKTADEAASYLHEALAQAHQQDDVLRVAITTLGLGRLAALQQNPTLALQHYNEALQFFRQQNVLTYLQEASLALADLLLQQQQVEQAHKLLLELTPKLPQAAAYLRYRYHELAARIFAAQGDWPQAYTSLQLANTLRFEQLAEQSKLQLDLINHGVQQAATDNKLQNQLTQQAQLNALQQRDIYLLLSAVLLLLFTLALLIILFSWRQRQSRLVAKVPSSAWGKFCQQIQQHSTDESLHLLAYAADFSRQLKQQHGEQHVHYVLQNFVQQLPADCVLASCIYDDVLWLAVSDSTVNIDSLQLQILQQLQHLVPASITAPAYLSLQLPLAQLLCKPWLTKELSALREALWLSWALCATQQPGNAPLVIALRSSQPGACEWRSNMVRQDLLNAIRLGSVQLLCQGQPLPVTIADSLNG